VASRLNAERALVARYLPPDTFYMHYENRDVWVFKKITQVGIEFEMAVFYDLDESPPGYCVKLLSPEIEQAWRHPHIGHIYPDGTVCFGGIDPSPRCRRVLNEAYAKACVWAEGVAIMIASKTAGRPIEFPFSDNNDPSDVIA